MTSPVQLANAISQKIQNCAAPCLTTSSAGSDLYEIYVWALVIDAARSEGATVRFLNRDGSATAANGFVFRSSPGYINSTAKNYTHAEIIFPNCEKLEAHLGVYVAGKSKVKHECDVAVLYKKEADLSRAASTLPRASQVVLAVECKFYASSLMGINLGRSFVGLTTDIMQKNRFFVGVSSANSLEVLLQRHDKNFETNVNPNHTRIEERLKGDFEKVFRNYKLKL